jgi:hypothetical protein
MDKRRLTRKKTRLPARFGATKAEKLGMITDVSSRGIYLATNAVLARGSEVQLQVRVPSGEQVTLQGKVMRCRRVAASLVMLTTGGMGVQLENPPAGWRQGLALPDDK